MLEPVNHLTPAQRKAACRSAGASLTDRIAEYRPLAIVTVLLRIKEIVESATIAVGSDAPRFAVPFPGNGQQARFQKDILPRLPRASLVKEDGLTRY